MTGDDPRLRVAAAQIAPVFLDRAATLARVVARIDEAGAAGCGLVAFGETLVPGYPLWLDRGGGARFDDPTLKALHARLLDQAVVIERGDLADVCAAAARGAIAVVLGVAERAPDRGGHSVYCTAVYVDPEGRIRATHRKLVPTHEERLAWAPGDGAGLVVHDLRGFRVSILNCWENWMPLARAALHAQGANLHVALWPGSVRTTRDATRFVAREGRMHVLSAGGLCRAEDLPRDLPMRDALLAPDPRVPLQDGGSCLAGPDGAWIVEPVVGAEGLVIGEVSLARVREERQNFDPAGHYARPDVLSLRVDRRRRGIAEFVDE